MVKKRAKKSIKKSKSRNLVVPILAISTLTTLGLALYFARPKTIPIGINEVASTPTCNSNLISENFDGASLDTNKWGSYLSSETSTTTLSGGILNLISGTHTPSHNDNTGIYNTTEINGNFIAEVTVSNINSSPISSGNAVLSVGDNGGWLAIGWYKDSTRSTVDMSTNIKAGTTPINKGSVDVGSSTSVKLKLSRDGSIARGYVDSGNGYQLVATMEGVFTDKSHLNLASHDYSNSPGNKTTVSFDNLKFYCPTSKPVVTQSCNGNTPVANITWTGGDPDGSNGFVVNLFEQPWNGNYSNKTVGNVHTTDASGFIGTNDSPQIKGQTFVLKSGKKYGTNIWNGTHSPDADSFTVSSCIPTPANPRSTCNSDGKSVRLMWDTVSDAQSYKVRVDDKAGKVLSFDNVSKGEYIATISPNTTYSWWAHATRDGFDSAETTRLEFKCAPTSTPTPSPTVKPTVKATAKPTTTPTVAPTEAPPTNPSYVAPSTTTSKYAVPAEPSATPTPTKSKNAISRFFTWLANLFE